MEVFYEVLGLLLQSFYIKGRNFLEKKFSRAEASKIARFAEEIFANRAFEMNFVEEIFNYRFFK